MRLFDESLKALSRATDAIEAAEYDLAGDYTLAATNRAYYVYFYCMTALLLTKDVHAKTHQGVHTKFSELFIKTGIFSGSIAIHIKDAFNLRQEADYDFDASISAEIVKDLIHNAKEFYELSRDYLQKLNAPAQEK